MTYRVNAIKFELGEIEFQTKPGKKSQVFLEYFKNKSGDQGWVIFAETDPNTFSERAYLQKDGVWKDNMAYLFKHKKDAIDMRFNPPHKIEAEKKKREEEEKKQLPAVANQTQSSAGS